MARQHVGFHPDTWEDYLCWQNQDRKTLGRINILIRECQRDPFRSIGKPEPLREKLAGCWSRCLDDTHRLVYRIAGDALQIINCRYHYRC